MDDVADSVMLVGFLGAVFGSPAPKAVQKKKDASASILWYDEEAKVDDQLDLVKELLASPAPASITKKSSRREENVANLWEFDEGEDIPDLAVQAIDAKGADPVVFRTNSCIHADKQEKVD